MEKIEHRPAAVYSMGKIWLGLCALSPFPLSWPDRSSSHVRLSKGLGCAEEDESSGGDADNNQEKRIQEVNEVDAESGTRNKDEGETEETESSRVGAESEATSNPATDYDGAAGPQSTAISAGAVSSLFSTAVSPNDVDGEPRRTVSTGAGAVSSSEIDAAVGRVRGFDDKRSQKPKRESGNESDDFRVSDRDSDSSQEPFRWSSSRDASIPDPNHGTCPCASPRRHRNGRPG